MSETTQDYSQNHVADSYKTAKGVDLAPILITPSSILWRIELLVYCSILFAATIALFPFFLTAFYWPIVWLIFVALVLCVLRERWHVKNSPAVSLSVTKQVWRLRCPDGESTVKPFGEILLWGGVIVLHLKEIMSGRKYTIVVLPDSVKADDWRCLRVWLRTGLRKNI